MCNSALLKADFQVLVVDGNADSRELLMVLLEQLGIKTIAASCVSESLEMMQQRCPDLLISEITLPGEDGYTLMGKVKAFESAYNVHIPAIALTTRITKVDQMQAFAAGFCRHLCKPINIDEVIATVTCVIQHDKATVPSTCTSSVYP